MAIWKLLTLVKGGLMPWSTRRSLAQERHCLALKFSLHSGRETSMLALASGTAKYLAAPESP